MYTKTYLTTHIPNSIPLEAKFSICYTLNTIFNLLGLPLLKFLLNIFHTESNWKCSLGHLLVPKLICWKPNMKTNNTIVMVKQD